MGTTKSLITGLMSAAAMACAPVHQDRPATVPATASQEAPSLPLHEVRPGLYSAGQPTDSDWGLIAARGVTTVINLRPVDEMQGRDEAAEVNAAGMRYIEIPVANGDAITLANASKLSEAIKGAKGAPVLVHCASANRAGGLLAVMAAAQHGLSDEAALALGRKAGMASTEMRVREVLSAD